jgi:hypothetical protein
MAIEPRGRNALTSGLLALALLLPGAMPGLTLAAASFLAATATAGEAAAPPGVATADIDEVVVRGKQLSQQINEAEDEYFALFNDVNKDDRYDTHCVYLRLAESSRIESRACIPGFVADAMADWAPFKARCQPPQQGQWDEFSCLDRNNDNRVSLDEAAARPELEAQFDRVNNNPPIDNYLSREEMLDDDPPLEQATAVYMPPPPQLVLMEGSAKWYEHMMKVTNGDPRLKKMADHLGGLYKELAATQQQFEKLEADIPPRSRKRNPGPRVH